MLSCESLGNDNQISTIEICRPDSVLIGLIKTHSKFILVLWSFSEADHCAGEEDAGSLCFDKC